MGFSFRNGTNAALFISFGYFNLLCRPTTFVKTGWYRVDPGQTRQVWSGFVGGQTFYYYAEDAFGRRWAGQFFTQVPSTPYRWCWDTGCSTCRTVGFRGIRMGLLVANFTLTLTAIRSANKAIGPVALPSKTISSLRKIPTGKPRKMQVGRPLLGGRTSNRLWLPKK
jgi:hypothetical protein